MAYPDKTDKELARIERQLRSIYSDAVKELNDIIGKYENGWNEPVLDKDGNPVLDDFGNPKIAHHKGMYERYNEQYQAYKNGQYKPAFDKMTDEEMKSTWWYRKWKAGELTDEEMFEKWWLSQQGRDQYWVKLRDEMAERLTHTNEIASDYINGRLPKIYTANYNELTAVAREAASSAGVAGVRFNMIDDRTLKAIMKNGDRILPYAMTHIDPDKDTPWNRKKLQGALYQGIVAGDDVQGIAKRFMSVEKMNESSAIRNARTAVTNARCAGMQDAMDELAKQGCETMKFWDDVHDSIPPERQWHWDAAIRYSRLNPIPRSQPFIVNGEELMYPGDSSHGASGSNLYNCRCREGVAGFEFKSMLTEEQRKKANIRVTITDDGDFKVVNNTTQNKTAAPKTEQKKQSTSKTKSTSSASKYLRESDSIVENLYKQEPKKAEPKKQTTRTKEYYTGKELDKLSTAQIKTVRDKLTKEYYTSGKSGISFGNKTPEEAAKIATSQPASKTAMKKDIMAMQKKLGKKKR